MYDRIRRRETRKKRRISRKGERKRDDAGEGCWTDLIYGGTRRVTRLGSR